MSGSQKFIARNRAPRVQIEYDVELYGAQKKIQLPFVMGVMSDLAGKSEQPPVADRKFLEIDADNFDDRMKGMSPRASFSVPNTLTGEGNLAIDLTFEKMEDFSPQAIAAKVDALAPLLEARKQLTDLMAYMDGKSRAEDLIENLLATPALLEALAGSTQAASDMDAALDSLKARMPPDPPPLDDTTDRTLADLAARPPEETQTGPDVDDVLTGIERREETNTADATEDVLAGIERQETAAEDDRTDEVLSGIERAAEEETADSTADVLAEIQRKDDIEEADDTADILQGIERREDNSAPDATSEVLAGIERRDEEGESTDSSAEVLASIERRGDEEPVDNADNVLAGVERHVETDAKDEKADVLAGLERVDEDEPEDAASDILAGIERREEVADENRTDEVLSSLERREKAVEDDNTGSVLAGMERRDDMPETDDTADVLAGIERTETSGESDRSDDVLADIDRQEATAPEVTTDDILASLEPTAPDTGDDNDLDDVLAGLEPAEDTGEQEEDSSDVLQSLKEQAPAEEEAHDLTEDILASLDPAPPTPDDGADLDDILAGLETPAPEPEPDDVSTDDALATLEPAAEETVDEPTPDAVLQAVETEIKTEPDDGSREDILAAPGEDSRLDTPSAEEPDGELEAGLDELLADLGTEGDQDDAGPDSLTSDTAESAEDEPAQNDLDRMLADLDGDEEQVAASTDLDDLLGELAEDAGDVSADEVSAADDESTGGDLDDLLADLGLDDATGSAAPDDDTPDDSGGGMQASDDAGGDLDALLAEFGGTGDTEEETDPSEEAVSAEDDLESLLADLDGSSTPSDRAGETDIAEQTPSAEDDLDSLLADLGGSDDTDTETGSNDDPPIGNAPDTGDDLDALLADLGETEAEDSGGGPESDLDALLADLGTDSGTDEGGETSITEETTGEVLVSDAESDEVEATDDLDALLADLATGSDEDGQSPSDDLDALLADLGDDSPEAARTEPGADEGNTVASAAEQAPFGTISAPQPERSDMNRNRFRMAFFGDFTGRAARGLLETGDTLAQRKPILLDVDTVEDVIESFATTLTLPLGKDGEGIEVKLRGLDDLHPDELYENVEIFEAISGLRQQLGVGSMAAKATEQLRTWAEDYSTPVRLPKRSAATSVPPDLKLSDFQALIGDTRGTLTKATPADELIARIVGPHVVKGPDAGAAEMLEAVDEALSSAMRLVLHHPDFQAVESQWRSLDLLARRIETDSSLEIVLYDVSAEELAADLSAQEDLAQSGLFRLLTDVMDPEEGDGGFSALFGLYTFEETPPHAELLARVGQVAAHVDAPFFAAITPAYLETAKEDRHRLVAEAWDTLRAQPQAAYLGLASPRFLLRQPYGPKSDPCYEFEFEEFTPKEGLKGLLWANPVVLVAILLAGTWKKDGKSMNLGSLMSLGDLPFTYVNDRYGDQVALPCTERNLTSDPAQATLARGYMPVVWVKGRNEVRLGSFRSLAGAEIAGPWAGDAPTRPAPPQATLEMEIAADAGSGSETEGGKPDDPLAEPGGLPDSGEGTESADGLDLLDSDGDDDGQSLDDLLASFADDDDDATGDDDDMDPELAALLEGL